MTKPSSKFPDLDPSGKSLETLATVTERIVQNRGDSVAIVGLVGLFLVSILAIMGFVSVQAIVHSSQSQNPPSSQSQNQPNATGSK